MMSEDVSETITRAQTHFLQLERERLGRPLTQEETTSICITCIFGAVTKTLTDTVKSLAEDSPK